MLKECTNRSTEKEDVRLRLSSLVKESVSCQSQFNIFVNFQMFSISPLNDIFFTLVQMTIGIVAGILALLLIFFFVLVFVFRRAEVERIREKKIEAERIIPRHMRPSKRKGFKPKDR